MKNAIILLTSLGLLTVLVPAVDVSMDATEPQWVSAVTLMPKSAIEIRLAIPAQATWRATMTWTTWTATVARVATNMATYTAGVRSELPSPLLDRLVRNKPSIWGNKAFYVLLGVLYLTLLCLFLKQIISPLSVNHDLHDEFTHNSH